LIIASKRFHKPGLHRKQKGTFANYFQIFFTIWERFCLFQAAQEQNKTFVFLKNDIKTKPKLFKLCQGFLKTNQNFWLSQNKF